MTRERGGATRQRDDHEEEAVSSATEIGRLLRDAREERGLDLLSVHDRLDRPITQLEALENGDLVNLPDQALALSTLRRYAAFLNLDGDVLALQMIDAWSSVPPAPATPSGAVTNVVAAVTTGPDHLRAFTQTGQVPKVGGGSTAAAGGYGYDVATGPPTGTFPVVPHQELRQSKRAVARSRRRLRAPTGLKVVTWSAVALLVVVLVGIGLARRNPQWMADAHILRVVTTGASAATAHPAGHQPEVVVMTSSDTQSSNYTVSTRTFAVGLSTSGPCWVQVTSSGSSSPLVSGVQPAGKRISLPANGTMTVQVGSSAVVVAVTIGGKFVFLDAPHNTPYTYTFAPTTHV